MLRYCGFFILSICIAIFGVQAVSADSSALARFDGLSGSLSIAGGTAHITT